jgi:hypothetical protein
MMLKICWHLDITPGESEPCLHCQNFHDFFLGFSSFLSRRRRSVDRIRSMTCISLLFIFSSLRNPLLPSKSVSLSHCELYVPSVKPATAESLDFLHEPLPVSQPVCPLRWKLIVATICAHESSRDGSVGICIPSPHHWSQNGGFEGLLAAHGYS